MFAETLFGGGEFAMSAEPAPMRCISALHRSPNLSLFPIMPGLPATQPVQPHCDRPHQLPDSLSPFISRSAQGRERARQTNNAARSTQPPSFVLPALVKSAGVPTPSCQRGYKLKPPSHTANPSLRAEVNLPLL